MKLKIETIDLTDKQTLKQIAVFAVPVCIYLILFCIGVVGEGSQQFSDLANSFVHGHTYFLHPIGGLGQDPVFYQGKIYWDEGPFPAVVLMPFVGLFDLFHKFFYQGYIKWAFVLATSYFIYSIAKTFKYSKRDSFILMLGFTLGSVYIGVQSVSSGWLFAQVVCTFFMFWAFYEYYRKRRWWLIGLICAMVFLTRASAGPLILFFALVVLAQKVNSRQKVKNLAKLLGFMVVAVVLIGLYNYQRFGSPLDNGNQYQLLYQSSAEARSMGVFSLSHLPTNLYTAILRGPNIKLISSTSWSLQSPYILNNPLGMSIFLTSPYLLYLFFKSWSKYPKEAKYLVVATAFSALLVLSYFGDGSDQFGYRYSLDFLPELFLIFILLYKLDHQNLSKGMKFVLLGSGVFNFYILASYIK